MAKSHEANKAKEILEVSFYNSYKLQELEEQYEYKLSYIQEKQIKANYHISSPRFLEIMLENYLINISESQNNHKSEKFDQKHLENLDLDILSRIYKRYEVRVFRYKLAHMKRLHYQNQDTIDDA